MSISRKGRLKRACIISFVGITMTFANYTRLTGTDNIKPIHIIALLACGMCMGIFVFAGVMLLKGVDKEN